MRSFIDGTPTAEVLLDRTYKIALTLRALRIIRERLGTLEVDEEKAENLAVVLWAALDPNDQKDLTVEDVEVMIHPGNMVAIGNAIRAIRTASTPEATANPTVEVPATPES